MTGSERDAAQRSIARAVDIVAQMVEYIRGSRVDEYAPLFALNARLCTLDMSASSSTADGVLLMCLLQPSYWASQQLRKTF